MIGYLLDTNVISMLAPFRGDPPPGFYDWLERADGEGRLFLSVVSVHEIEKGIAGLERKGSKAKASELVVWLSGLRVAFEEKILAFDVSSAAALGRLEAQALASGADPGMADSIIAGIARTHDLTVISRNTKHFRPFGIAVLSPEEATAT